ncbi:hypothetical protein JL722_9834 [Aureococcus anophagefferens]|nr:hypothetical protein JL722_9834 [Aureococcus anophagefferens]
MAALEDARVPLKAALEDARVPLKYYVSPRETAQERVGGALDELAKRHALLEVERVSEPGDADLIWLNTPSKAAKAACRDCAHYNHVAGARSALEDKCRMGELQRRMGERTLRSETFADRGALRAWVAKHGPALDGGWVVKDATANSGVGLWFAASPGDLAALADSDAVDARGEVVLQQYLQKPMLWRGRKLQFRVYAVWQGRSCFLYAGAMAQVCAAPYAAPVPGEALAGTAHVTNVSVNKDADEAAGGAFVPERPILDLAAAHPAQFAAMKRVLRSLSRACAPGLAPAAAGRNRFELVGVDFLCDDDAADPHAWLVECNCPPNSAGSAAEGPIEAFHHALMVDVLDRFVVGGSARGRWVAVDAGAPDVGPKAFSERFGPSLFWSKFDKASQRVAAAAYGGRKDAPPPAASTAVAARARKRFALYGATHGSSFDGSWAFFENAGGSQVPAVADARAGALNALARRARRGVEGTRAAFAAAFLGASGPCFFAANASTALDTVARALDGPWLDGGAIVVCDASHEANVVPWLRLAAGRELRTWRVDGAAGAPDLAALDGLLDDAVRVVAVPHASNVTGDVYDAATVVAKVRASCPGALVIVDGVAYAPHRRADAAGLEADCYVCAFHKAFGPHLAAAALSSRLIDRVARFPAPGAGARAFEVGTVSAEACAGGVALAEAAPLARLLAFLDAAPRATVLRGAGAVDKLPTVAFSHANLAPAAVVAEARHHKIALRCGDFLSPRLLDAVLPADARPAGVVRVSLAHYNTVAEVDRLCAALERMEKW